MMEFVNGKDDIPYMKWKIKFMFQTTNQVSSSGILKRMDPMKGVTVFASDYIVQ